MYDIQTHNTSLKFSSFNYLLEISTFSALTSCYFFAHRSLPTPKSRISEKIKTHMRVCLQSLDILYTSLGL